MTTFYDFAIKKIKDYIKENTIEEIEKGEKINTFTISSVFEIVFDKPKEIIIEDIIENPK